MPRDAATISPEDLAAAQESFIAAWGQMGSTWGISRTMAEVFALLYIVGVAMNTDEVMERLSISRGNASMSLRALVDWGIVSKSHKRGDRKEYFEAETDVWEFSRSVIRERLRREIHPVLASLHEIRDQTDGRIGSGVVDGHNERLDALVELTETLDRLGENFVGSRGKGLEIAARMLAKVT